MDANTPNRHADDGENGRARWQSPTLTLLGSLASQTMMQTQGPDDMTNSGTIGGDSGTIL